MVLGGTLRFLMFLYGSCGFVMLGGSWWFLVFFVVLGGSWWFLVVFGISSWFLVVLCKSSFLAYSLVSQSV